MKFYAVALFLVTLSFGVFANNYNVYGEDSAGNKYEGRVRSDGGDDRVLGELTDNKGREHEFTGHWKDEGRISGVLENSIEVYLKTR